MVAGGLILLALLCIVFGLCSFFDRHMLWAFQSWQNKTRGITASERTDAWEAITTFNGIVSLVAGSICLWVGVSLALSDTQQQKQHARDNAVATIQSQETITAVTQTAFAISRLSLPTPGSDLYTVVAIDSSTSIQLARADRSPSDVQTYIPIGVSSVMDGLCSNSAATAHAHALLDGQQVYIAEEPLPSGARRFGHYAYIWSTNGTFYNLAMIADGFASARETLDTFTPASSQTGTTYTYHAQFSEAEIRARATRQGVWATSSCTPATTTAGPTTTAASPRGAFAFPFLGACVRANGTYLHVPDRSRFCVPSATG